MTPKLRFSEFTDDWQVTKLGDLAELTSSKRVYLSDYVPHGIPFYRGKEITELKNNLISKDILYISKEAYEIFKRKYGAPKRNEILITAVGTLGNILRVRNDEPFYFKDGNLIWLRNITENPYFLEILLENNKHTLLQSAIGSSQKALTIVGLNKIKLTRPEKPEQQKIADFLTAVDDKIKSIDKKVELLKKYKKGVMQKIFTQQIRFKDEDGNAYHEWENKKLSQLEDEKVIELGRGDVISKIDIAEHAGNYPIYSSSIKNGGLFGAYGKYMFDEELITWSIDGGGNFFHRPSAKFSVTNVSGWLRVLDGSINCKFLSMQLQRLHERQLFDYSTKAHPSVIRDLYIIAVPDVREQKKIADFIATIDDKLRAEEDRLDAAKEFKSALLQRMFV